MKMRFMFYATDDLKTVEDLIMNRIHSLSHEDPKPEESEPNQTETPLPAENPGSSDGNIDVSSKM